MGGMEARAIVFDCLGQKKDSEVFLDVKDMLFIWVMAWGRKWWLGTRVKPN